MRRPYLGIVGVDVNVVPSPPIWANVVYAFSDLSGGATSRASSC
jgi:hypothetical protein